ncbi:hypothetical protein AA0117_g3602 [Alternaria alternata]|jgi:GNAT superfamily N-acetyltransferase|uniref:N-acetyltransferase domain-containing protein n=1 Tax=Alternaria alternata TaxID=5599 RepID=A0A4Q4NNC8_ALTAL|nr:hypothetical protein AA0117_g3602 [Alternaria alternata]
MTTNQDLVYVTTSIPKSSGSEQLARLALKFREFKIHALKTDPKAFSSELDIESQLPQSTWVERITEPGTSILICVAMSTDTAKQASEDRASQLKMLLDGDWAGMFTIIGPVPRDNYIFPESGQPAPGPEGSETRWQLTGLFTLPGYRGCGIAKRLTETAIHFGKLASTKMEKACGHKVHTRIRLIVHCHNTGVVNMYEKFGFVDNGRVTLAEACIANKAADMIPIDADPEKWHSRLGIAMEYLV